MTRGHVKGTKTERPGASDWYQAIEQETLARLEAEAALQPPAATEDSP